MLVLVVTVLIWLGVFEGELSDDAQIRRLIDDSKTNVNDHDWSDLFAQCDMTAAERDKWEKAVPQQARFVELETLNTTGFISVPTLATEYSVEVHYVSTYNVLGNTMQGKSGTAVFYFVKRDGRWWIDMDETAKSVPHFTPPK